MARNLLAISSISGLITIRSRLTSRARASQRTMPSSRHSKDPCTTNASTSIGSRHWPKRTGSSKPGGSNTTTAVLTWLLATNRRRNIFCWQAIRHKRRAKRPPKTSDQGGPPTPSASKAHKPYIREDHFSGGRPARVDTFQHQTRGRSLVTEIRSAVMCVVLLKSGRISVFGR